MKQAALFMMLLLMVGCTKKRETVSLKESNQVAITSQNTVTPDKSSKKLDYPPITGLWESKEYLPNLKKYNFVTKTDSLADFYTHLLYQGDSMLYGNKRDLMEEDNFFVLPNNEVRDYTRKPAFTIKAFTDSTLEIELKATNKIKKYRKVLPLGAIKGKAPSILFSKQLELLTNKWFAGKYEILFPDYTRSELTFKKDGFLSGFSNYNKYVLSSSESKDLVILSSNSKALPDMRCEMIQEADIIQLFVLQPIEDIDDPLIRTGKSFGLKKL